MSKDKKMTLSEKTMQMFKKERPRCSLCGRFCALFEKAPEGEHGDIYACSVCDLNPNDSEDE